MKHIYILTAIISTLLANSLGQILYALGVNRVLRTDSSVEGQEILVPFDLKVWEVLLYGIYKHRKLGKDFTTGLLVSSLSMFILAGQGLESWPVAIIHTVFLTAFWLSDAKYFLLPNILVFPAFFIEAIMQYITEGFQLINWVTCVVVFGLYAIVFIIASFTKSPFGGGDVKIMLFVSLWQGPMILITLLLANLFALTQALRKRKKTVAFGPPLVIAILVTEVTAKPFITWLFDTLLKNGGI
ncbi:Type IV leader peptidase family protein [compost metagenome]